MPSDADTPVTRPSHEDTTRSTLVASWGASVGLLPHVLHHVGLLAGASLLVGATGQALFGVVGLVASLPFLARLKRRFGTWRAPGIALGVMVIGFSLSALVIAPMIGHHARM